MTRQREPHAMNIEEAIIHYGTEAVREYGRISGIVAEDVIPEKMLGRIYGLAVQR
jgi:hypothetical protein